MKHPETREATIPTSIGHLCPAVITDRDKNWFDLIVLKDLSPWWWEVLAEQLTSGWWEHMKEASLVEGQEAQTQWNPDYKPPKGEPYLLMSSPHTALPAGTE